MKCSHKDKEEKSCKKRRNGSRKLHYGKQRIGEIRFFCFCESMVSSNRCRRPEKEDTMSKYFTYAERIALQKLLAGGLTFKEIGRRLGKDGTTISREVRKHMSVVATGYPGYPYNPCKNRRSCRKKNLCGKENCHRRSVQYCKLCPDCGKRCEEYVEEVCGNRFRDPYVCNSCEKVGKCTLLKNLYDAEHAQYKSHDTISSARSGLCTSEEEIARLNALISPLVKQGQSLHQIYVTHTDEIMCSEKTLYNYLDAGLFDICSGDLPRKSRLRPRKQKKEYKVDKGCRIGRNYLDFQKFLEENPDTAIVQMDSVIGAVGGKCLLTIHFVETSMMLAFLRDANTSQSVLDILDGLQEKLGMERFQKLFPVILTDNGSEFSNPRALECDLSTGELRTRIFYCDAGKPYQKGAIEVNHELIRRVLTDVNGRNRSFNNLTQEDVTRMMDHINSYKRKKLNDRNPYETFSFYHGEEVLRLLGCTMVAPNDITLRPKLLNL